MKDNQIQKLIDARKKWLADNRIQDWNDTDTNSIVQTALSLEKKKLENFKAGKSQKHYPNKDILEGNKLIAEFDGWKFYETNKKVWWAKPGISWSDRTPPEFNHDWNLLMPVVEKINGFETIYGKADVIIYRATCHINDPNQIIIETTATVSLIDCVWQAVVQFIQWYNTQK